MLPLIIIAAAYFARQRRDERPRCSAYATALTAPPPCHAAVRALRRCCLPARLPGAAAPRYPMLPPPSSVVMLDAPIYAATPFRCSMMRDIADAPLRHDAGAMPPRCRRFRRRRRRIKPIQMRTPRD